MIFLAFLSRCFSLKSSSPDAAPSLRLVVAQHYEEDEEDYGDDDPAEEFDDSLPNSSRLQRGAAWRPSRLFSTFYEEEAAHLSEADEVEE